MEEIERLARHPNIVAALEFIRQDREFILEKQIELVQIPAPSHEEREKALRFAELLLSYTDEDECAGRLSGDAFILIVHKELKIN